MKKFIKGILIACILLSVTVVVFLTQIGKDSANQHDERLVSVLETQVLPYILEYDVSLFRNSEWCKILVYKERSVAERDGSSSQQCLPGASPFQSADMEVFDEIYMKLQGITDEGFYAIRVEEPLNRSEHSSLQGRAFGLGFHLNCDFCRTRYVYFPEYQELPPDISGEIRYIPINKDWYRVEQDWN